MIISIDKKYFVLSFIVLSISNATAMFQTAEQKKFDAKLEEKLQDAACNEIISTDFSHASTDLKNRVIKHNSVATNICKMAENYNKKCAEDRERLKHASNLITK